MRRMRGFHWAALSVAAGVLLASCAPPPPPPPPAGPDLVATDITWPVPLVVGERVPFSFTVTNVGDTATPPDTIVDVLVTLDLDTPNVIDVGWSDNIRTPLAPGESRVQTVNGGPDGSDGLWTVNSGNHTVRAYVNSGNLPTRPPIVESTRENNAAFASFTVTGASRPDRLRGERRRHLEHALRRHRTPSAHHRWCRARGEPRRHQDRLHAHLPPQRTAAAPSPVSG